MTQVESQSDSKEEDPEKAAKVRGSANTSRSSLQLHLPPTRLSTCPSPPPSLPTSLPTPPPLPFQVTEALDTVGRLVSVAPLIPDLVERLHALRELHERASQFAGSVAYIGESQDQLSLQTKDLKSLLNQVSSAEPLIEVPPLIKEPYERLTRGGLEANICNLSKLSKKH